jgi:hypothetical protein
MHRLEVRRHSVGVPTGHLKRTVAQHFLEMEHGAAAPEIIHREGVRKEWRVRAGGGKSEFADTVA